MPARLAQRSGTAGTTQTDCHIVFWRCFCFRIFLRSAKTAAACTEADGTRNLLFQCKELAAHLVFHRCKQSRSFCLGRNAVQVNFAGKYPKGFKLVPVLNYIEIIRWTGPDPAVVGADFTGLQKFFHLNIPLQILGNRYFLLKIFHSAHKIHLRTFFQYIINERFMVK
jgi:hypothetical protein